MILGPWILDPLDLRCNRMPGIQKTHNLGNTVRIYFNIKYYTTRTSLDIRGLSSAATGGRVLFGGIPQASESWLMTAGGDEPDKRGPRG